MSSRSLWMLTLAAALSVLLAVASYDRYGGDVPEMESGSIFTRLKENANRIDRVVISAQEAVTTLVLQPDGWKVKEKGNYPADFSLVRQLLIGAISLTEGEPKTTLPENYRYLELQPLEADDSKAVLIEAFAGEDNLAAFYVGKQGYQLDGSQDSVYIRKKEEKRCWLAKGKVLKETRPKNWLNLQLLNVDSTTVESMTFGEGKDSFTILRGEAGGYVLQNAPETPLDTNKVEDALFLVESLNANDVVPKNQKTFTTAPITVMYHLESDEAIRVSCWQEDGKHWINLAMVREGFDFSPWLYEVAEYKISGLYPASSDYTIKEDDAGNE